MENTFLRFGSKRTHIGARSPMPHHPKKIIRFWQVSRWSAESCAFSWKLHRRPWIIGCTLLCRATMNDMNRWIGAVIHNTNGKISWLKRWYCSSGILLLFFFILCDFSFSAGDFAEPEHDRNDYGLAIQGAGSDDAAAADFNCVVFPSNCRPRAKL